MNVKLFIKENNIKELNLSKNCIELFNYFNHINNVSNTNKNKLFIGLDKTNIQKFLKYCKNSFVIILGNHVDLNFLNILNLIQCKKIYVEDKKIKKKINNSFLVKKFIFDNTIIYKPKTDLYKKIRNITNKPKTGLQNNTKTLVIEPKTNLNNRKSKILNNRESKIFNYLRMSNINLIKKIKKEFEISDKIIKNFYDMNLSTFLNYFQNNHENGILINELQIKKFYNCYFYENYINFENINYKYLEFKKKYFDDKTFEYLSELIILNKKENYDKNKYYQTILLIHIGDLDKGEYILNNLLINNILQNNLLLITSTEDINLDNYSNYIFYKIKNLGNDITPGLKIYLDNKNINHDYVLKLHTKSDDKIFFQLTNYFLENYHTIVSLFNDDIELEFNTFEKFYVNINQDKFCKKIINKYMPYLSNDFTFCCITFFFTRKNILLEKINLIRDSLKPLLINNYYYDNLMFLNNSIVHGIERIISASNKNLVISSKYNELGKIAVNIACHINNENDLLILDNNLKKLNFFYVDLFVYYSNHIPRKFKSNHPNVYFRKTKNHNLDFGKHFVFYRRHSKDYKHFILLNDSVILLEHFKNFYYFVLRNACDLIGYLENKQITHHYQSWCYYLTKKAFSLLHNNFKDVSAHQIELHFPKTITNKTVLFEYKENKNLFFSNDFFEFYNKYNFRILKKKQIFKNIGKSIYDLIDKSKLPNIDLKLNDLPKDFSFEKYKLYNQDLNMTDEELREHFLNYGLYEWRKYSDNNIIFLNHQFEDILKKYDLNFINHVLG